MNEELTLEQVIAFLVDAPMFGDLDAAELSQVVQVMQVQRLRAGQWVFREGDVGDAWYVVFDGEVEVIDESPEGDRIIAILGRRACFGEMAILDGSPRSASVRACRPVTAFRFPRQQFAKLLAENNLAAFKLVHQIALVLVSRQRRTTSRLVELMRAAESGLKDRIAPLVDQSSVAE